jgi:ABC-type amino acid transport substrate-binding protein
MVRRLERFILLTAMLLAVAGCRSKQGGAATPTTPENQLVVGTTGNYPPFEYYSDSFALTGFEVDLMRAVGEKLGRPVVFKDYAFSGLIPALQLQQVNAVIAAMSYSAERDDQVDFSNIYYSGEGAVLGPADVPAGSITTPEQLAKRKVGVERGSTYETWLQTTLVDTGQMPQSNLFAYASIDQAVADLKQGRLDLVLLDKAPAESFVEQGGVALAGEGVAPQLFAIAVRQGDDRLRADINQALADLSAEGTVDQLARQYLSLESLTVQPVPTAAPVPVATAPACLDNLAVVDSLTLDDQNMQAPPPVTAGQSFRKTWRVKNTGTCAWDSHYGVYYGGGNVPAAEMGGQPVMIEGTVAADATYDLSVDLVAPLVPGTYQAFWEMRNAHNEAFGERLEVGIVVPPLPTPTVAPTQTPVPNIVFTANPTTVNPGGQVMFQWAAQGAQAVYFYPEGRDWQQYPVGPVGQRVVWPDRTTTWYLRVVTNGNVEVRQITIQVVPVANAPQITYFLVSPENELVLGQCVSIQWGIQGDVSRVTISANGAPIWDGAPLTGYMPHCPPGAGNVVYGITATGPGGTTQLQHEVNVILPTGNATPTPPASTGPTITAFSVTPATLPVGGCVRIYWQVAGTADEIQISRDTRVVLDNASPAGDIQDCLGTAGTIIYSIKASDAAGHYATSEATVTVQ